MLVIRNFSAGRVDLNDSSRTAEVEASLKNLLDVPIGLVRYVVALSDCDGILLAADDEERTISLAPGEEKTLKWSGWVEIRGLDEEEDLRVKMFATLYTRDRVVFEDAFVPESSAARSVARAKSSSEVLDSNLAAVVTVTDPDDDGDVQVKVKCGVINRSSDYLKGLRMLTNFVDADGMTLETQEEEIDIAPGSAGFLESEVYWRHGSLRHVKVRAALSVFRQAGVDEVEAALSQLAEDDDDDDE
jgi:hypothetical protein